MVAFSPVMQRTMGMTLAVVLVAQVLAWRFAPAGVAAGVSVLALLLAITQRGGRGPAGSLLAAVVVAVLGLVPGLWDCDACLRLSPYDRVLGVPVLWLAMPAYLAAAWALWAPASAGTDGGLQPAATSRLIPGFRSRLSELTPWLLAGSSLYFLWLSWQLSVLCTHCLAIHVLVLAAVLPGVRRSGSWSARLACAAIAGLGLYAVQHPPSGQAIDTGVDQHLGQGDWSAGELADLMAADRGRRHGSPEAPLRVELVVDFTCPHCAAAWPDLTRDLFSLADAGRVQVVVRPTAGPRHPTAQRLALLAHAAAIANRQRGFLRVAVGQKEGLPPNLPEDVQVDGLSALVDGPSARPLSRLYALDQAQLRRWGAHVGDTPQLLVFRRGETRPFQTWRGETEVLAHLPELRAEAQAR